MNAGGKPDGRATADGRAKLDIDLSALCANWRVLRDRAPAAECAAVVKADAYGLGLEPVSRALFLAGARTFFVAQLQEGLRLRKVLPEATIYVLNGLMPGAATAFVEAQLRPVLGSLPEVEEWSRFCRGQGLAHPAAVHFDTGMNRLGLTDQEARSVLSERQRFSGFLPALMMSHLACADQPGHPLVERQLDRFRGVVAAFPNTPASLANSAGTLLGSRFHFDLVRPGIALYGAEAIDGRPNPMQPVVRLSAPVIRIREVAAGETVGYGATYRASRNSRVAIVGLGYADGYLRSGSGSDSKLGTELALGGRRVRVVGRISMDLTAVDVTDIPPGECDRGTLLEVFGTTIPVDEVARNAGTIGYELLTRLGRRFDRQYL